ncbi:MAG: hypothetical protein Kow0068_09180 [Marinilabiliales bacterium]
MIENKTGNEITKLYIKNMVCPRCIEAVQNILDNENIKYLQVDLGEVTLSEKLSNDKLNKISTSLKNKGFELLQNKSEKIINIIKSSIIHAIYSNDYDNRINISEYLSNKTNHDYSYISSLFSSTMGITIEQYYIKQKIERVKELLIYDELSLKEISYKLNYSSVAHLSRQFKKITGLTPGEFKKLGVPKRKTLDSI